MSEIVENKCEHCDKVFARPSSLLNHTCEPKRRWDQRTMPANRIGFEAWADFLRSYQPSSKKVNDHREFIKSRYYKAFVKFGTYCVNTKVINPVAYTRYLLKKSVGIDYWCSDKQYDEYLLSYLKTEDAIDALERGIKRLIELGETENIQLSDTFKYLNENRLCMDITAGRISPWILYNIGDTDSLWSRFNEQQITMMLPYIDPDVWKPKFMRDRSTTEEVKFLLKEAGL